MFADIAGFTGLSERLGDQIIPLLSSYLDTMSREVSSHGGTIDKFIGDAVMAFWGAPVASADHAVDACRAALACQRALRASGLTDDSGRPLRVRIGVNSGDMLVGNIGSEWRLNYTAAGYYAYIRSERCWPGMPGESYIANPPATGANGAEPARQGPVARPQS